jgi:hypothetical protein
MATQQTTFNTAKPTIRFKVSNGDDLQVINKVISVLGLAPSDYTYSAKEGTITTNATTKESILEQVKALGFDFLLGGDNANKNYKTEIVTVKRSYNNQRSFNDAYELVINALYKKHKQVLKLVSAHIDYINETITVNAEVRVPTFNELDYKVALILTNFSYVTSANKSVSFPEQEAYDELYKSIDKLIDKVSSDFNKSAPPELKTFVKLFLT